MAEEKKAGSDTVPAAATATPAGSTTPAGNGTPAATATPGNASDGIPPEIASLTEAEAKKKLANLQPLLGRQGKEIGDLKQKVVSSDSILGILFNSPVDASAPAGDTAPPAAAPAVNQNLEFKSFDDIDAQYAKDIQAIDANEATRLMNRRIYELNKAETDIANSKAREAMKADSIVLDFIKDNNNAIMLQDYITGLSPDMQALIRTAIKIKPLFVEEVINAAKGKKAPELIAEARKLGAQGALNGTEDASRAAPAAEGTKAAAQVSADKKFSDELRAVKEAGAL